MSMSRSAPPRATFPTNGRIGAHFVHDAEDGGKRKRLAPPTIYKEKGILVPSAICFRSPVNFRSPIDRLTMRRQRAEDALDLSVATNAEKDAKMMRMSQKSKQAIEAASQRLNQMKAELAATRLELQATQVPAEHAFLPSVPLAATHSSHS